MRLAAAAASRLANTVRCLMGHQTAVRSAAGAPLSDLEMPGQGKLGLEATKPAISCCVLPAPVAAAPKPLCKALQLPYDSLLDAIIRSGQPSASIPGEPLQCVSPALWVPPTELHDRPRVYRLDLSAESAAARPRWVSDVAGPSCRHRLPPPPQAEQDGARALLAMLQWRAVLSSGCNTLQAILITL